VVAAAVGVESGVVVGGGSAGAVVVPVVGLVVGLGVGLFDVGVVPEVHVTEFPSAVRTHCICDPVLEAPVAPAGVDVADPEPAPTWEFVVATWVEVDAVEVGLSGTKDGPAAPSAKLEPAVRAWAAVFDVVVVTWRVVAWCVALVVVRAAVAAAAASAACWICASWGPS